MPVDLFWNAPEYLLEVYSEAYNNRTNREAWLNGLYCYKAMESAVNNMTPYAIAVAMNEKAKFKALEYPCEPIDFSGKNELKEDDVARFEEDAFLLESQLFNNPH